LPFIAQLKSNDFSRRLNPATLSDSHLALERAFHKRLHASRTDDDTVKMSYRRTISTQSYLAQCTTTHNFGK